MAIPFERNVAYVCCTSTLIAALFSVLVGILLSFGLLPIWLFVLSSPASDTVNYNLEYQYRVSCLLYTLSAFLELATEPLWLVCQLGMFLRARIVLEAIANIARAVGIIFALWFGDGSTHGLYLLACPQVGRSFHFILNHVCRLIISVTCFFSAFTWIYAGFGLHSLCNLVDENFVS